MARRRRGRVIVVRLMQAERLPVGGSAPPLLSPACVGLGGNLGDARATLALAWQWLGELPQTRAVACSRWYRSAPVQAQGPEFINGVALLHTSLSPWQLLEQLQSLELRAGRERPYRNAPRTLDLDLLLMDELSLSDDRLILPHPRLHERAFVLLPLLELMPDLSLAGLGRLSDRLASVADQPIEPL